MPKKQDPSPRKDVESEVWAAITAFEQILEAMPNDRASLEALAHAYEQLGDHTKAKDYLMRLGDVLVEEGDSDTANELLEKLNTYAADDPRAKDMARRIKNMAPKQAAAPAPDADRKAPQRKGSAAKKPTSGFNIAEELALAWNLMEAKELTQEEYASVVQDLTEMSAGESASTVSVLHVLEGRAFKNLEKILGYISKECGAPFVSLSSFDLQQEPVSIVPLDFAIRRGALIFEVIGKDALAVVMNPHDKNLLKEVESIAGRRCHFFITLPSEFDKTIEKIPEILKNAAQR